MDTEDIKARGGEERLHGGEGGWNGEIWGREKLGEWNVDLWRRYETRTVNTILGINEESRNPEIQIVT